MRSRYSTRPHHPERSYYPTRSCYASPAFVLVLALLFSIAPGFTSAQAQPTDLFFSEYVEGSSLNKAVEIYNGTGAPVDLSSYELAIYFNGSATAGTRVGLSGTLAAGGVYVIADDGADPAILDAADLTPGANFFNGDDAVALEAGGATVDIIGQVGVDPGSAWTGGGVSAQNQTLRRLETACTGDADPTDAFDPSADYAEFPQDTFDGLGAHVAACGPGGGPALLFTEVMYNPASAEDDWEWVEIYNAGASAVDLTGYVFDDANSLAHAAANIAGGTVAAGEAAILYNADDLTAADFEAAWGTGINLVPVTGWDVGALNNGGDQIALWASFADYDGDNVAQASALTSLSFDDGGAWPADDGSGSIYLTGLSADPTDGANWALSSMGAATPTFNAYQSMAAGGNSGSDVGSPGPGGGDPPPPPAPTIVINEILADPASGAAGDANGDGTRDASGDEFIEIINTETAPVDVSGWTISDGVSVRHTFPAGTTLEGQCGAVVFGGGSPTGGFGGVVALTASDGLLGFNNGGDTATLADDEGTVVASLTYGGEGGDNQSLTRDPDLTGTFVQHSVATGSGGALFSPGTRLDGTAFTGCTAPPPPPPPDIAECQLETYAPQTLFPSLEGQDLIDALIAAYKPAKSNMPGDYGVARDFMYAQIDNQGGVVEGVYSGFTVTGVPQDIATARGVAQGGGLNAEHTWPQSLGVGDDEPGARTDLHHLFPARSQVNSARSNYPFGEILDAETDRWYLGASDPSTIPTSNIDAYSEADFDTGRFEPREEREGNTARALFYVAAVYQSLVSDPDEEAFFEAQLAALLVWNGLDAVDQDEYERTCAIAALQDGKVNPFVIDPTLASRAFGAGVTAGSLQRTPFVAAAGAPTTVTAQVVASEAVTSVELLYATGDGAETAVPMTDVGGGAYEGQIPGSAYGDGDRVTYRVVAEAGGETGESAAQGFFAGTTPMATLNDRAADGTLLYTGYGARVQGVATASAGTFSTTSLDVYLQDASGGISLFQGGAGDQAFEKGTEYVVTGALEQFNGKTQLGPTAITEVGPVGPPTPQTRTIAQLLEAPEALENTLVRIEGVTPTGPFPTGGSANVPIEDGTGTLNLRIDGTTGITAADEPGAPFDLVGIFTQFDPTLPLTEGYQVLPRSAADLGAGAVPAECTATMVETGEPSVGDDGLGRVALTFSNPDGIVEIAFSVLDNFAVDAVSPAPSSSSEEGGRPTLGFAAAPQAISLTLRQVTGGQESAYFALVSSPCPTADDGQLVTNFDPPVGFESLAPDEVQLSGSYPNPTRGAATIEYGLPEAGEVTMAVYDALGRRVATLAEGRQAAGRHQIRWDGRSAAGGRLASGLYFVRLEAGGQVRMRRLTIVR